MIGWEAAGQATSGGNNVFVGSMAGNHDTATIDGYQLTIVGARSNGSASGSNDEVCLGYNVTGAGNNTFKVAASSGAYHTGNTTTWSTTSDQRIKKNIVDNNVGLDALSSIQVRNFEYKTKEEIISDSPELEDVVESAVVEKEGVQLGVIAQELEKILPECVNTSSTGVKTVDSDNIIWYLINAVKELSVKVKALEAG
jgi:hypothetical protein